jgi:hypothetical protein
MTDTRTISQLTLLGVSLINFAHKVQAAALRALAPLAPRECLTKPPAVT